MITPENFREVLESMGFWHIGDLYTKQYDDVNAEMKVDIAKQKLYFPEKIGNHDRNDTYNDSLKENLVVFECVDRLLSKGYRPEHITLEKQWNLGHDAKGGRADICVEDIDGSMLFIIECKTFGKEYEKEKKNTISDGGQLFSYWQQEKSAKWLALYASDFQNGGIVYQCECIDCRDDKNIIDAQKKDKDIKLFENSHTVNELHETWVNTYNKKFQNDVIFHVDTKPYQIGVLPLRKRDLKDFSENDKVVNRFEEILRHNNVSDKENAFNRLTALFICKLVDESKKTENQEVEFQYKNGTDSYESLQDRLQKLHQTGMKEFMKEEIFYVSDDYAENLIKQFTGQKRSKMVASLKETIRNLKYFTNNDFAFKDVHNEELFLQNGKILVEVVELFQNYRIIGSHDIQKLGDLFEQLLNKGFKQNEGQFFTPIPITRFIWDCLPLGKVIHRGNDYEYPKIIDYSCGAGHFLTEGVEAVNAWMKTHVQGIEESSAWAEHKLFGVEKDYRLARVSKISLFMHGAGDGNIIFGDGLENYAEKDIIPGSFDILVANPPYSVAAFKPQLNLKNNELDIRSKISDNGSEIETLFVERIAQLLKPKGIAAVILPSSILNKENESFIGARESILKNFFIRCIAQFGSKTFGATGTNTVILFLEKFDEPPKRSLMLEDSVDAILNRHNLEDWEDQEIFDGYLNKISVSEEDYLDFLSKTRNYQDWAENDYFALLVNAFTATAEFLNKQKQPSYRRLSSPEQQKWCNKQFYEFALKLERERLFYFALIYNQTTLIITAPDDNKAQENFLGYTWSNRKGQEGIQIKKPGGLLYDDKDRESEETIAAIVRHAFDDDEIGIDGLDDYYYYLPLQDMLDFSDVRFNKGLKIARSHLVIQMYSGSQPTKKLSEIAELFAEKVLFSEINAEEYITTENMLKNKQGIIPYTGPKLQINVNKYSKDDILLSNIRPYLKKIWFSDREGGCSNDVLVIHNKKSKMVLSEYLYYVLQQDMFFDYMMSTAKGLKMPRGDKSKMMDYIIPIPSLEEQRKIIVEFKSIDQQISAIDLEITELSEDVKSKFVEMFGDPQYNPKNWNTEQLRNLSVGGLTYGSGASAVKYNGLIRYIRITDINEKGYLNHDVVSPSIFENQYLLHDGDILFARSGATVGKAFIYKEKYGKSIYAGYLIRCIPDRSKILPDFLYGFLNTDYYYSFILQTNTGSRTTAQPNINANKYGNLSVIVPPLYLQQEFCSYVQAIDKQKSEAQKRKDALIAKRNAAIENYFK